MQLPQLPQNKQVRQVVYISIGVFIFIVVALFYVSQLQTVKVMPGQAAPVVEAPLPPAPPNADNSQTILELFSPSDASVQAQHTQTTTSQQIEQTLTVSYVLTKCLIISQDDYADAYRALLLYAQYTKLAPDQASADEKLHDIAESANASYSLIYSKISCNDKQLPALAAQLTSWTDQMFTRKQQNQ